MHTYLHIHFNKTIKKILNNNTLNMVLIAISGGQDSMCLIQLMEDFKKNYQNIYSINIEYIYIDHQWKKDSKSQIQHLINFIKNKQSSISIYQIKYITASELTARYLRYKTLINHALKHKHMTILTAHSQTDKIETFFQQLMRGTSIDGATSLSNCRNIHKQLKIFRPLIDINRVDINWFCRKFYLPIWSDITNYDNNINRNRLRNEFIPYLRKYFMQNLEHQINTFLETCNIDNEYIKQNTIKLYLISRHKNNIALNYSLIKKQHIAIQARALQLFFLSSSKCIFK
uniref:tRNA(Ile)-lysidine synthase n=1 Tax=Schimmelmannia schousboei TaxID=173468 RepID=A0A1C9C8R7_9FLOR|nr:tRNA(Ile)-lysidine synthase [Schimmelmannia schousboei]AOM64773.1 tRNA(Ile)-lysidine synthase [Schimmelmannia schousboei]